MLTEPDDIRAETFLPLPLTPSRQPEQTAAAVRKAFERLGDTAWQLGTLTLDDPASCYAPPSKLNEVRRTVFEKLSENWTAARKGRCAAISAAWGLGAAVPAARNAAPAQWSLKLRADTPLLPRDALEGIDTLVLAIGHTPLAALEPQLAAWRSVFAPNHIRLALPLITRTPELPDLRAALRTLIQNGWKDWECADLAGCHMLGAQGLTPISSDWSLYALNRVAAAELASLGITSHVLSPENSLDNIHALTCVPPSSALCPQSVPELLAYQHTPLFISETAPCMPHDGASITLSDRRGRSFITQKIDRRWITVSDAPFCIADRLAEAGAGRFRIDLSWSPDPVAFPSIIRPVRSGHPPPKTHSANFDRGFS